MSEGQLNQSEKDVPDSIRNDIHSDKHVSYNISSVTKRKRPENSTKQFVYIQ